MSGIIPPSILTMQYAVDNTFYKYVNLSFPYRVKIESIWFTADDKLSGGATSATLERVLRLAAVKTRNAQYAGGFNSVTDYNLVWGGELGAGADGELTEQNKPTIWFGMPDSRVNFGGGSGDAPEDQQVQSDSFWDTDLTFRSTAKSLPSVADSYPWNNSAWDAPAYAAKKYKTDLQVMNPDEFMSLFLYTNGGDWNDYVTESGVATIFVQYTGVGGESISNPTRIWD